MYVHVRVDIWRFGVPKIAECFQNFTLYCTYRPVILRSKGPKMGRFWKHSLDAMRHGIHDNGTNIHEEHGYGYNAQLMDMMCTYIAWVKFPNATA